MRLMQGDCLERMREIPDGSVDMILADLPYGVTCAGWDRPIPLAPLWEQIWRVCKRNAAVCLFAQMPFAADLVVSNRKRFRYEWIWQKPSSTGFLNSKRMPLKAHEQILVFYRSLPTYHPQMVPGPHKNAYKGRTVSPVYGKCRSLDSQMADAYYPVDVVRFSCVGASKKRAHPTQKPADLLAYLICTYTRPGETVLDNVMGSGSTGVACVETGRDFIGIELDEQYFKAAEERIQKALSERSATG